MITKLLSLLATTKGAAAAAVVAAAALTGGVAATNEDVHNAVTSAVETLTNTSSQPAVVGARNDADQKLRDAFQKDQQKIEKLHGTQVDPSARSTLNDTVGTADAKLRARLQQALDDVAVLTLGRNGHDASASPGQAAKQSGSPDVKVALTTDTQKKIDDLVTTAVTDMDKIASDAEAVVTALPAFQPGKPADVQGGKPADVQGGKPNDLGKPTDLAPARPSPTR